MKISFKKDFCLWLVSPSDGTVKKLRFTSRRALLLMFTVSAIGVGVVLLASDYTRVQFLRAREYFSLLRVTKERNALRSSKDSLEVRLKGLKTDNQRVRNYEHNIRGRVSELSSILESAEAFGIINKKELDKISLNSGHPEEGIGGLRLDCSSESRGVCSPASVAEWSASKRTMFSESRYHPGKNENLAELLNHYVEALNQVPFMVPVIGYVSSPFGLRRSPFSRRREMHEGIDFSSPSGSEVLVTADGVVKSTGRKGGFGLMIEVSHGRGVETRYGHLSKMLVKKGEKVCQGQLIGLVGSTGRSTGPHLHYEVRVAGKPLNPIKLFELGHTLRDIL